MRKTMNLWVLLSILAVIVIGFFYTSNKLSNRDKELDDELYRLKTELANVQNRQNELKVLREKVNSDSYIENLARNEYGYISRDEIRLVIENPEALYENGIVPKHE